MEIFAHNALPMSLWKQPHRTWIVGHRGAPRRARENTLDSLDFAESFGADAVEFDLRQTRDGEAVLFHDEDILLGTQRIPVRSFTSREIERLTLPSELGEYHIPRLEQVFHRFGPRSRYIVEVKTGPGTPARDDGAPRRAPRSRLRRRRSLPRGLLRRGAPEADAGGRRRRSRRAFSSIIPSRCPAPGQPTPIFPPVDAIGPRRDLVTPALLVGGRRREPLGEPLDGGRAGRDPPPARGRRLLDHDERSRRGRAPARPRARPRHGSRAVGDGCPSPRLLPPGEGVPRPS